MAEADGPYRGLTGEEVAARRLLERHGLTLPPADIVELVSLYADVEEEVYPVRGDAVLIEFPQGHKKPLIVMNAARKYPVRRRFTLAHELAHILLGWHFGNFSCSPVDDEKYLPGDYGEMEGEANRFAAELLLPTPWVETSIEHAETTKDLVGGILANALVSIDTWPGTCPRPCARTSSGWPST